MSGQADANACTSSSNLSRATSLKRCSVVSPAARINPAARVYVTNSNVVVDDPAKVRGKRVVTVDDGPTLTHGELSVSATLKPTAGAVDLRLDAAVAAGGGVSHFSAGWLRVYGVHQGGGSDSAALCWPTAVLLGAVGLRAGARQGHLWGDATTLCTAAGGMTYGAGWVAAEKYEAAEIVDPRPFLKVG